MRTSAKIEFIGRTQDLAGKIIDSMKEYLELKNEYVALAYQSGGANAITDADLQGTGNTAGMTAVEFNAAVTALTSIDTALNANSGYKNLYIIKRN